MTFLKISIPVYKTDKWDRLDQDGKIEISSEVDALTDGYESLKIQIDSLLAELNCQTRLAENCHNLELQIDEKARALKHLTRDFDRLTALDDNLKLF